MRRLKKRVSSVNSIAFSPNGRTLASENDDNTIGLWNVASGKELRSLKGHTDSVSSVAFSPDGRTLASGSDDKTIKLWDVASGKELRSLKGHPRPVNSVAFSPDGRTLLSRSGYAYGLGDIFQKDSIAEGIIKLWDVVSGKELRSLEEPTIPIRLVAFNANGNISASGSADGSIQFWSLITGKNLATLTRFNDSDWAIVDSAGRFDASPGGMKQLHYVIGLKTVPLEQFKDLYYEPGLLAKVLGFNKEPLRAVPNLADLKLPLEVKEKG